MCSFIKFASSCPDTFMSFSDARDEFTTAPVVRAIVSNSNLNANFRISAIV